MESHRDSDAISADNFLSQLENRAKAMKRNRQSDITGGKDGEPILLKWDRGDMHIVKRPDDEQGILRISVGGGSDILQLDYCVFRGDRSRCAYLLEQAARALRDGPLLPGAD